MPDLHRVLQETNELLRSSGLPLCQDVQPVADGDTANPTLIGHAEGRRYVVKVCLRHSKEVEQHARLANAIADSTMLPIPRHRCSVSGDHSRLPLVIMDWMEGQQLRLALTAATPTEAAALVQHWGSCMARLNAVRPEATPLLAELPSADETHEGFNVWLDGRLQADLARLAHGPGTLDADKAAIFLKQERLAAASPAIPGLLKADLDVRDFLAVLHPSPHITAILDWEQVHFGDCLWVLTTIFVRLHLMNLSHLWSAFLSGYGPIHTTGTFQGACRYYIAARAVIAAAAGSPSAYLLLGRCLNGDEVGFSSAMRL